MSDDCTRGFANGVNIRQNLLDALCVCFFSYFLLSLLTFNMFTVVVVNTALELERYWHWVIGYWAIFADIG